MTSKAKILLVVISLLCIVVGSAIIHAAGQEIISMPFRATNDTLHKQKSLITLDFLIPSGTYIDEKMTIGEVIRVRFEKPTGRLNRLAQNISDSVPLKYRLVGTVILYLFLTLLFLLFFRIFTWARYFVALSISFFAGAFVYFFMPDLVLGKIDDLAFVGWAIIFCVIVIWYSKKRNIS